MELAQSLRDYFSSLKREKQDTEFMPEVDGAILEDSPWLARATVWSVSACLLVALIWAKFAVLEEVTTGEGKAIPSSKVQVIQNLEGGIVTEIFVREGQVVSKGDTLLRLDDTRFLSNRGETEADRMALVARVERLSAEAEGRPLVLPDDLVKQAPQLVEDEMALYRSRQQRLQTRQCVGQGAPLRRDGLDDLRRRACIHHACHMRIDRLQIEHGRINGGGQQRDQVLIVGRLDHSADVEFPYGVEEVAYDRSLPASGRALEVDGFRFRHVYFFGNPE